MSVRILIELNNKGKRAKSVALANTGYETNAPEILIPINIAEKLKIWPKLPQGTKEEEYISVGGIVKVYKIPQPIKVKIILEDRETEEVDCNLLISETEKEVIISDKLIDELKIEIIEAGRGKWKLKDDEQGKLRNSIHQSFFYK